MANARPPQPQLQKRPAGPVASATPARPQQPAMRAPAPVRAGLRAPVAGQSAAVARAAAPSQSPMATGAQAAAPTPRPPADPVLENLIRTIVGLEAVVEEETLALSSRQKVDLDSFSNRKSQGLMELNRSMQHLDPPRHQALLTPRLDSLRSKLAANQAALQLHLDAVREISGIIAHAIQEQESDGTYSHTIRRPEAAYGYD